MKKVNHVITRYEHKGFYIDIVNTGECLEAWMSHQDYGISMFMFGEGTEGVTEQHFLELVEANFDEYATIYGEDYCY